MEKIMVKSMPHIDVDNMFCIPITFNNPLKACFSDKKYIFNQTHPTQIVISIFLNKKITVLVDF